MTFWLCLSLDIKPLWPSNDVLERNLRGMKGKRIKEIKGEKAEEGGEEWLKEDGSDRIAEERRKNKF